MGGKISTELHVDEDALHNENNPSFKGHVTLINHSKSKIIKLERPLRVALQLRNRMVLEERPPFATGQNLPPVNDNIQTVWKIGNDELAPRGTALIPGENVFVFDFPTLAKELQQHALLPNEAHWRKKFGSFIRMKYEYVIRAGTAPQAKDVIQYPSLPIRIAS